MCRWFQTESHRDEGAQPEGCLPLLGNTIVAYWPNAGDGSISARIYVHTRAILSHEQLAVSEEKICYQHHLMPDVITVYKRCAVLLEAKPIFCIHPNAHIKTSLSSMIVIVCLPIPIRKKHNRLLKSVSQAPKQHSFQGTCKWLGLPSLAGTSHVPHLWSLSQHLHDYCYEKQCS